MRLHALLSIFVLALALPLWAENEPAESSRLMPAPPAPADHIYDDARLLDDSSRAELSAIIRDLKAEADVDFYVAAYTILNGDIDAQANRLRLAWADGDRGLVMVYRRGSQQLTFSATNENDKFIPSSDLYAIFSSAVSAALQKEEPRERIVAAAAALSRGLKTDLKVRDPKRSFLTPEFLKLLAGLLLALAFIGCGAYAFNRILARKATERDTAIHFPRVIVESRLGANFGGGTVAEIDFEKAPISVPAEAPRPSR